MSLLALQRDFQTCLTSESTERSARVGDSMQAGFAVYLNNYRSQLLACLTESFATVRSWLGDAAFEIAATTHINNVPPRAWTLDAYGFEFPDTLDALYSEDPEVAELARLERDLAAAFVGPDATPVDPGSLANIDWDAALIRLAPTFVLLPITTNVGALWTALQSEQMPPPVERLPERGAIAIWRDYLTPMFRSVMAEEVAVLEQIRAGQRFGEICNNLVASLGAERGAMFAGTMLSQWLRDRVIVTISS